MTLEKSIVKVTTPKQLNTTTAMKRITFTPLGFKRNKQLPAVCTQKEVEKLIDTATNIRNKAIIALIYSSGLRVGEVCKQAPTDIYMCTMQVHVRYSKNHGDHWTILSEGRYMLC